MPAVLLVGLIALAFAQEPPPDPKKQEPPPAPEPAKPQEQPPPKQPEPQPPPPPPPGPPPLAFDHYRNFAELEAALRALVQGRDAVARLKSIGKSVQGRDLWLLELGNTGTGDLARRPALLVVAGVDGDHLIGAEAALRAAEVLLTQHGKNEKVTALLDRGLVWLVPRLDPDGAEASLAPPRFGRRANLRPVDDDRDGAVDEDLPEDLNGDGVISQMRVKDPAGEWIPSPDDPRLMRKADRARGERGAFQLHTEGLDNDGDGAFNEDGPGGVLLDRNFPHAFQENDRAAGRYPLSEPESKALADFLLAQRNVALVLTYGTKDNLLAAPRAEEPRSGAGGDEPATPGTFPPFGWGGGGRGARGPDEATGRGSRTAPRALARDDLAWYEELGAAYRRITGLKGAAVPETDGNFHSWVYYQLGLPSLAARIWSLPEAPAPEAPPGEGAKPGGEPRPGPRAGAGKKDGGDDAAWLAFSDRDLKGAGFVPWKGFAHPTLGEVEIGGLHPFLTLEPPPDRIAALVEKQAEFVLHLGGLLPRARIARAGVKAQGGNVFLIEAEVENEGWLPTSLQMGTRNRRLRPTLVRLTLDGTRLLAGEPRDAIPSLAGSGGRKSYRWVVWGPPGAKVTLSVDSETGGVESRVLELK